MCLTVVTLRFESQQLIIYLLRRLAKGKIVPLAVINSKKDSTVETFLLQSICK